MAQYYTDWSEYSIGVTPSGWTKRYDSSATLTIVADGSNNVARATGGTSDGNGFFCLDAAGTTQTSTEFLVKWRAGRTDSFVRFPGSIYSRTSGTSGSPSGYWATSTSLSGQNPYITEQASSAYAMGTSSAVAASTWYWTRQRTNGTSIQIKVWADGTSEPGSWTLTLTDSHVTGAGWFGIGDVSGVDGYTDYAQVVIATGGDTAVLPARITKSHTVDANIIQPGIPNQDFVGSIWYGGWGGAILGATPGGSTPNLLFTRIETGHTVDANLYGQFTLTNNVDAVLRKQVSVTHTLNAMKRKAVTKTFTVSAVKRKVYEDTHQVDAHIRVDSTQFAYTVDAVLRNVYEKAVQTDANLVIRPQLLAQIDALLRKRYELTESVDSVLRAIETIQQTVDAIQVKRHELETSTDAVLRSILTAIHSVDAALANQYTLSQTIDAELRYLKVFLEHTVDAKLTIEKYTIPENESGVYPVPLGNAGTLTATGDPNSGVFPVPLTSTEEYTVHEDSTGTFEPL